MCKMQPDALQRDINIGYMLPGYAVSVMETTGVPEEHRDFLTPRSLTLGIPCNAV
jgi:hypothetical protein